MPSSATATVMGHLTADPELRFTTNGNAVCAATIAVNRRRKNAAGEWEDAPASFFDIECWGKTAEHLAEAGAKGAAVACTGRLEQQRWEATDGGKRSKVVVVADVVMVASPNDQARSVDSDSEPF